MVLCGKGVFMPLGTKSILGIDTPGYLCYTQYSVLDFDRKVVLMAIIICNRVGCNNRLEENPIRPSGYKGRRYRRYCSDACRKAANRADQALGILPRRREKTDNQKG